VGERVVVFGQGPVGLLTTRLLGEFPLADLLAVDPDPERRRQAQTFGADRAVAPAEVDDAMADPADVALELSGNPDALDAAIDAVGFAGDVIVGSWYGSKPVSLDLGSAYHRSHVRVRASQVSRLDPDHADRWDKERRMDVVRSWIADTDLDGLLTHRYDIEAASDAYRLLAEQRDGALQVVFEY
jgi:alcohol dehydrogenase